MTRFAKVVAAAVAFLAVPVALYPRQSDAITAVETPAWIFGPGLLSTAGQNANLCVANMGDGSVRVLMGFLNASNTNIVLSAVPVTLGRGAGDCHSFTNASRVTTVASDPTAVEFVAFVTVLGVGRDAGGAIRSLAPSLEIMNAADNHDRVVAHGLLLPAVHLPGTPAP
jgi:hypothetical protein